jgi:hypothetical protein
MACSLEALKITSVNIYVIQYAVSEEKPGPDGKSPVYQIVIQIRIILVMSDAQEILQLLAVHSRPGPADGPFVAMVESQLPDPILEPVKVTVIRIEKHHIVLPGFLPAKWIHFLRQSETIHRLGQHQAEIISCVKIKRGAQEGAVWAQICLNMTGESRLLGREAEKGK